MRYDTVVQKKVKTGRENPVLSPGGTPAGNGAAVAVGGRDKKKRWQQIFGEMKNEICQVEAAVFGDFRVLRPVPGSLG